MDFNSNNRSIWSNPFINNLKEQLNVQYPAFPAFFQLIVIRILPNTHYFIFLVQTNLFKNSVCLNKNY